VAVGLAVAGGIRFVLFGPVALQVLRGAIPNE